MDAPAIYQEIVENAVAATGARLVAMARYDAATGMARTVAWAGSNTALLERGLEMARRIIPGFEPGEFTSRADYNEVHRAVYRRGEPTAATLAEIAAESVDGRLLGLAESLLGIRRAFMHPLEVQGAVVGSMTFLTAEPLPARERQVCAAFARQVALTMENARLLDEARASRQELATIVDAAADSIFVYDLSGKLLRANRRGREQLTRRFGHVADSVAALIGEARLQAIDGGPVPAAQLVARAARGEDVAAELILPEADGGTTYLHVHLAPLRDEAVVRGIVVISRDITELRQAVSARAQLDGAVKTARTAAHQLNNKLSSVTGYGSMLLGSLDGPAAEYARLMVTGAEDAAAILTRLQQLIRFEETDAGVGIPMLDLDASTGRRTPAPAAKEN